MENDTVYSDGTFDSQYPAPPGLYWPFLLTFFLINLLLYYILKYEGFEREGHLINTILGYFWFFYISWWLKQLNEDSTVWFWTLLTFVISITSHLLKIRFNEIFPLGYLALFCAREEVLKHYNKVEPIDLELSPVLTFFLGFIYLQYHFCRIADAKLNQQQFEANSPSRT
jgi:hypothetical protein